MPATHQGTILRTNGPPILNLEPGQGMTHSMQRQQLQFINRLNAEHIKSRPEFSELQARIASYELAFNLQSAAPEALDISKESKKTQEMYGLNDKKGEHPISLGPAPFGRQCLTARRLVERGVRFRFLRLPQTTSLIKPSYSLGSLHTSVQVCLWISS
jgi:hypothetical protein